MRGHQSIEAMAHAAFRSGKVDPAVQRYARAEIERRGIRPLIDEANAQLKRAFQSQQDESDSVRRKGRA